MDETRTNEYVADLTNRPKCALCQDAGVRIYKKDHCRRCYDLIRKEDRLKKKIRNLTGYIPKLGQLPVNRPALS